MPLLILFRIDAIAVDTDYGQESAMLNPRLKIVDMLIIIEGMMVLVAMSVNLDGRIIMAFVFDDVIDIDIIVSSVHRGSSPIPERLVGVETESVSSFDSGIIEHRRMHSSMSNNIMPVMETECIHGNHRTIDGLGEPVKPLGRVAHHGRIMHDMADGCLRGLPVITMSIITIETNV